MSRHVDPISRKHCRGAMALLVALSCLAGCAGVGPAVAVTPQQQPAEMTVTSSSPAQSSLPNTPVPENRVPATLPPTSAEVTPVATPTNDPDSREANENGEYVKVEWGKEVTFDEMLAMGKRGEIAEIEWYALPNAIRLITAGRQYFHVKNEKWGRSAKKEFDAIGVKTGKGGIPFNYYFCN